MLQQDCRTETFRANWNVVDSAQLVLASPYVLALLSPLTRLCRTISYTVIIAKSSERVKTTGRLFLRVFHTRG